MRIAIDARPLTGRYTGDRTYWRSLVTALLRIDSQNTYLLYSRLPIEAGELPDAPNLICRTVPAGNDRVWNFSVLPAALREDRPDVLHVQYTIPPPSRCPCPIITVVHDVSFRVNPQWFPRKDRILLNLTVPHSVRRAAHVLTISESSRKDIQKFYHVPDDKLTVTLLGLPDDFAAELPKWGNDANADKLRKETARQFANTQYQLDKPFVLAVGVLQPRKNLPLLAEAFGIAKACHNLPHQLAIAGKIGWGTGQDLLRDAARKHGGDQAADAVRFVGYVPDADLPTLYTAADVFAYPSLYEGFGFPPLEAMACGTPALISDTPCLMEISGDAAWIAPATRAEGIAEGLAALMQDDSLRETLIARGRVRAASFSWDKTAQETLAVYHAIVHRT
jgi:glycosyltransferase involved in cell wall biosynthesis